MTTGYLKKWTPFDIACRLRSLQQGTLNVGNTHQNKVNLYNLAVVNANGAQTWAKWAAGGVSAPNGAPPFNCHGLLRIWVQMVPGYVPPTGTND